MAFAYVGSFAGGFADGFLAAYQARSQRMYYSMMSQYYRYIMLRQGYNPDVGKFWNFNDPNGGWTSPIWLQNPADMTPEQQIFHNTLASHPNRGSMPLPGQPGQPGKGAISYSQAIEYAKNAGFKGDDIPHIAAIAMAETRLNQGAVGPAGEIGITQINPHAWPDLAKMAALGPQEAMNAAYIIYSQHGGWGNWSTDPASGKHYTPNNTMKTYLPDAQKAFTSPSAAPTTTAATTTGPIAKTATGQPVQTDSEGRSIDPATGQPVANAPAAAATPQAAETAAPGGQFVLPGTSPVPTPGGPPQVLQQPDLQAANARSPLNRDPYWRPNPPLPPKPAQAQPQPGPDQAQRVPLAQTPTPPTRPQDVSPVAQPARPATGQYYPPNYPPGPTPPARPVTPTPPTAGPPYQVGASPATAPAAPTTPVVTGGAPLPAPEPPKLTPPDVAPPSGGGGGQQVVYTPDPPPALVPYVDTWEGFQQPNPYAVPISFAPPEQESRKGGPIGYDDGGDVGPTITYPSGKSAPVMMNRAAPINPPTTATLQSAAGPPPTPPLPQINRRAGGRAIINDPRAAPFSDPRTFQRQNYDDGGDVSKPQSPIGKLSKALSNADFTGGGGSQYTPSDPPASIPMIDTWANYKPQTGYADGGDVDPDEGPGGNPRITPNVMALSGLAATAVHNAPAAYRAFTDPNNPTGPTAANIGAQLRNTGTALALPVITRDLLRGLYTNPQQMQPRAGVPAPPSQPAPQPMNPAAQYPTNDPRNIVQPTFTQSPMGQAGVAIRGYGAPAIGNAIISAGNWVDAHLPFNDQLKQRQDEENDFKDELREQNTASKRTYGKYARGGIVVKLQGGGNPATWGSYNQGNYPQDPKYGAGAIQSEMQGVYGGNAPVSMFGQPAHISTPQELAAWNGLTPDQQKWMSTASGDMLTDRTTPAWGQQVIYGQLGSPPPSTPAASASSASPVPTPAAPARQLTQFIPPAAPATPATTAVNPAGSGAPSTSNTTPTFGSGANATNANAIQSATNYTHYDDGGMVGDVAPTQLGPPPGLGGQGQAIPPFYYNPATYSQAGAPIGKGFTANSAAVYPAAPVPTYQRGGIVGYDDGGDVDETDTTPTTPTIDSSSYDTTQANMPTAAAQDVSFMRPAPTQGIATRGMRLPAPRGMRPPRPSMSGAGGGQGAVGVPVNLANENDPSTWGSPVAKPPNAPPEAPQIIDNQGNLSSGVTGAIAAGLHGLAEFLQMGPWGGGIPSQGAQTNRRDFANGVGAAPPQKMERVENIIDPDMALGQGQRLLAAMEAVYKWHLLNSDPEGAQRDMASMLMYARLMAHEHAGAAIKAYYQGDKQAMLNQLQQANNFTPNGENFYTQDNKNGTFHVENRNADNSILNWEANVGPQQILAAALQVYDGTHFWQEMEKVAYKYDPYSKAMVDQRGQADVAAKINAAAPPYGPNQGAPAAPTAPAITPAATPPAAPAAPAAPKAPTISSQPVPIPPAMGGAPPAATPASAPPPFAPSDLGGAPPSPLPTPTSRPDTTTAQPATPPPEADQRTAPAAFQTPPVLPERETVGSLVTAPRTDEEVNLRARTIHDQVFSPQGGHFLPGGVYRLADGTTYAPPPRYPLTGNKEADAEIDRRQRAADTLYHQAGIAAGQQAADDERQQVADLKSAQQTQTTVFHAKQQQLMENQRENARQKAAALLEAGKTQATAEAERVRLGHEHEAPLPDEIDSVVKGVPMGKVPLETAVQPHIETMFAKPFNPSGAEGGVAHPASTFITSDESKAALPGLAKMLYKYNGKNGMTLPQAADTLRLIVSGDPKRLLSVTKPISVPGDPSDRRVTLKVGDERGVVHNIVLPAEAFIEAAGVNAEFNANAKKTMEEDAKADELNKRKGDALSGILKSVTSPPPVPPLGHGPAPAQPSVVRPLPSPIPHPLNRPQPPPLATAPFARTLPRQGIPQQ